MTFRYRCYELVIESHLDLGPLDSEPDPSTPPDVVVEVVDRLDPPAPGAESLGGLWWRAPGYLRFPTPTADVEVLHGGLIRIASRGSDDHLPTFVLGTAFGALLQQRGMLVLHGNAVRVDGRCFVAVGHSGAGKSTLAAELLARGYDVLADDVVPVRAAQALPGVRRVKLWPDAVRRLGLQESELAPIAAQPGKVEWHFARASLGPLPIGAVYVLDERTDAVTEVSLSPLHGMARFAPLAEHTYRSELLAPEDRPGQLSACADLARESRVVRVRRPAGHSVEATAEAILADLRA